MIRPRPLHWMAVATALALAAPAQPEFKTSTAELQMAEGGRESVVLIESGAERFAISIPNTYGMQIQQYKQSIVFTSTNGASVITVRMTTNYAGALPKKEELQEAVLENNRGASLVQAVRCFTGSGPGLCFDLVRPLSGGLVLRMRDAYVSCAQGSFEFFFSCNGADYDRQKLGFERLLNSFRALPKPAKKEP